MSEPLLISDCAVRNEPAMPNRPCSCCAEPMPLVDVLEFAKREFISIGGCVMTDRPDLPLSDQTSWTADFSAVVSAIDGAIDQLVGVDRRTAPECVGGSSRLPMPPISGPTKYVQALLGNRKPAGGRL